MSVNVTYPYMGGTVSPYGSASSLADRWPHYHYFSYAAPERELTRTEQKAKKDMAPYIEFLTRPHQDLVSESFVSKALTKMKTVTPKLANLRKTPSEGRTVCPFTPLAIKKNLLFFAVDPVSSLTIDQAKDKLKQMKNDFLSKLKPLTGQDNKILKALVVVFPKLSQKDVTTALSPAQARMRTEFVKDGLRSFALEPRDYGPGEHNPDFKPGRTPIPAIMVRNLVDSDLWRLNNSKFASLEERKAFSEAFLNPEHGFSQNIQEAAREQLEQIGKEIVKEEERKEERSNLAKLEKYFNHLDLIEREHFES